MLLTCTFIVFYRYLLLRHGVNTDRIFFGFDTRMDSLIVGCTMAYILNLKLTFMESILCKNIIRTCALFGTIFMLYEFIHPSDKSNWLWSYGWSLIALSSAFIILFVLTNSENIVTRLLRTKGVVFTGKISYGLYLWHYPIFNYLHDYTALGVNVKCIIGVSLSYVVSSLSFYIIEQPLLRYKDLLGRKTVQAPLTATDEIAELT